MITDTTLWTALITPMHQDGTIHFDDYAKLIMRQEEAGNGILLIGSTGEGLALEDEEKRELINFVSDYNPSVPWMVGVGGFQLKKQVEWIRYCNDKNPDAYLLVMPLYAKPGPKGQIDWFTHLLNVAEKPCMLYNIPSRTGARLSAGVLKELSTHNNCRALKEASGSITEFENFRRSCPDFPLYSGDDALLPYFTAAGCQGLVSVAANVWPHATKRYVEKCLVNDYKTLLPVWKEAVEALFSASNPVPAKILLHLKKVISTPVVRSPLSLVDLPSEKLLLNTDKKMNKWLNQ